VEVNQTEIYVQMIIACPVKPFILQFQELTIAIHALLIFVILLPEVQVLPMCRLPVSEMVRATEIYAHRTIV
jgi:hypothetical protein